MPNISIYYFLFLELQAGEGNEVPGWWNDVSCEKPQTSYICSYNNGKKCKYIAQIDNLKLSIT